MFYSIIQTKHSQHHLHMRLLVMILQIIFSEKIDKIRVDLDNTLNDISDMPASTNINNVKCDDESDLMCNSINKLDILTSVDELEVRKIILKLPNKTSVLDPLPNLNSVLIF